jgi:Asp-tRNA(Asn)/Glu-tRNA(Gln) amidotransferase A subunit family amidase
VAVDADAAAAAELYPLLGCVLSIKDSVVYKGSSCTHGFRKGYNQPYDITAPLIGHLERLGAVVVCKGNVSQALMSSESSNMVFGSTSHPLPDHRGRSAGGSSGGDAANVAR